MRIIIETSDAQGDGERSVVARAVGPDAATPPSEDLAARAAAQGALSAGPAPSEAPGAEPMPFTSSERQADVTLSGESGSAYQSAGAAPAFLTGASLDEVEVESQS